MSGLTERQAEFVRQYCIDRNGKQAAIRAGYSERTAESQASRLLRNVKVRAAVEKAAGEARERTLVTIETLTEKMLAVYAGASDASQWGAAQQALMGLAKLHGLLLDRHEHLLKRIDQMTEAELVALVGEDATAEHVH